MSVIFQAGYALPGGSQPLRNARIAHSLNWLAGGTVVASTTAAGYFDVAPANSLTYERWKPSAIPATWEYNHGSASNVDYACIAGHTLTGCTIRIERWNGAAWVALSPDTLVTDNGPLWFFFVTLSTQRLRVNILSGTAPEISVIRFGLALQMEQPIFGGHTPIDLSRQTILRSNRSETGEFLGRTKQRTLLATSFDWTHMTTAWVEANWPTMQKAVESEPFFIVWRPSDRQHVGYCQTDRVPVPQNMGVRDFMSVELQVRGLAYD
ncbi:MAG: hypothetical protein ACEQSU_14850 [Microgenomates group bacterium]